MNEKSRPFLKWAGGKRQLLPELLARVPKQFGTYYEPFLGGGALYFELQPQQALLSDTNRRLIRTYIAVRDYVSDLIRVLKNYPYDKDFYLKFRQLAPDTSDDYILAAWFIYLNRTGYNGLYRVNLRNQFNVPFGRYTNPCICDEDLLRTCSETLSRANFGVCDFSEVTFHAKAGDFVYFDPPYFPVNDTAKFVSYTSEGFGKQDHLRLRDVALLLKRRGVHILISQSSAPFIRDIYKDFSVQEAKARRNINSKGGQRGEVIELLIQ